MTKEKTYFRPDDLKTALALLQRPDMHAVPLAGGSWLVPHLRTDVDLPGSNYVDHIWETPLIDATGRLLVFVTFSDGSTSEVLVP